MTAPKLNPNKDDADVEANKKNKMVETKVINIQETPGFVTTPGFYGQIVSGTRKRSWLPVLLFGVLSFLCLIMLWYHMFGIVKLTHDALANHNGNTYNFIVVSNDPFGDRTSMYGLKSNMEVSVDKSDDEEEYVLSRNGNSPILSLADIKRGITAHRDTVNDVCYIGPVLDVSSNWDSSLSFDNDSSVVQVPKLPVIVTFISDDEIEPSILEYATGRRIAEFCKGAPAYWLISSSIEVPILIDDSNASSEVQSESADYMDANQPDSTQAGSEEEVSEKRHGFSDYDSSAIQDEALESYETEMQRFEHMAASLLDDIMKPLGANRTDSDAEMIHSYEHSDDNWSRITSSSESDETVEQTTLSPTSPSNSSHSPSSTIMSPLQRLLQHLQRQTDETTLVKNIESELDNTSSDRLRVRRSLGHCIPFEASYCGNCGTASLSCCLVQAQCR